LQKSFDSILEFTKLKEKCLFCHGPLRACLTNFLGMRRDGNPTIHAVMNKGQFRFPIDYTNENFRIKATCIIDAATNKLVISIPESMGMIDQYVVKDVLDGMTPYIELYCPYKLCKNQYYLASYKLNINYFSEAGEWWWDILRPKLFLESFKTKSLLVQNDWMREETNIYSIVNENVEPIKTSLIDFDALGDNLINRIQTIAVFS
jgi:hypothetical protein